QRLAFQLAPDLRPPQWPSPEHPQQFHLDISVERAQLDAAEKRVLDLGASLLEGDGDGARNWRVYAAPAAAAQPAVAQPAVAQPEVAQPAVAHAGRAGPGPAGRGLDGGPLGGGR